MNPRAIRAARILRGLSQKNLASVVGRNQTWVSFVETGKFEPTEEELEKIKAALRPDELLTPEACQARA